MIEEKIQKKQNIGNFIDLDISWDTRRQQEGNSQFSNIDPSIYQCNNLYMNALNYVLAKLHSCLLLKKYNFVDPKISLFYSRENKNDYDIVIEFFSQIAGTTQFLFFEAEVNILSKFNNKEVPRIYFISCCKLVDEHFNQNLILNYSNQALKSSEKFKIYSVSNIILARYINIKELMNPEHFSVVAIIQDEFLRQKKAIFTFSIDEISRHAAIANFALTEDLNINVDIEFKNEIELDIDSSSIPENFNNKFEFKDKKKFLDNKSTDILLEFIEKKIASLNVLNSFNFEKGLFINSILKRKNGNNNYDVKIEFFKQNSMKKGEFLLFYAHINVCNNIFKFYSMKCFKLAEIAVKIEHKNLISEALLTLEDEYKLFSINSLNCLVKNNFINDEKYSCEINVINSKNECEAGFLLFYKKQNNIPVASTFIKSQIDQNNNSNKFINDYDIFAKDNYNNYNCQCISYPMLIQSEHVILALKFVENNKLLSEIKYNKNLIDLIAQVKLQIDPFVGNVMMTLIFITARKDGKIYVYQVKLNCEKNVYSGIVNFNCRNIDNYCIIEKKNITISEKEFQIIFDKYILEKQANLKGSVTTDILSCYSIYGENLLIKQHFSVKFRYMSNLNTLKFGLLTFSKDYLNYIPVNLYDLDEKLNFIDDYLLRINNEIIDSKDDILLDIKFNNVLKNNNEIIDENSKFSIIKLTETSKIIFNLSEIYHSLIQTKLKEKYNSLEFQSQNVLNLFSYMKKYENGNQELICFISMKIKFEELIITELSMDLNDMLNKKVDIKSIFSVILKTVSDNEFPHFQLLVNILWATAHNKDYKEIMILKVKKSLKMKNKSYFKSVYFIHFKSLINCKEYTFMYGETQNKEIIILKQITMVPKKYNLV